MAFPVVAEALRCYVCNAETDQFPLQLGAVLERYPSWGCGHRSAAISVLIVE